MHWRCGSWFGGVSQLVVVIVSDWDGAGSRGGCLRDGNLKRNKRLDLGRC